MSDDLKDRLAEAQDRVEAKMQQARDQLAFEREDLLRRYIWHVRDCEGVDYIDGALYAVAGSGGSSVEFSADEIATLRRLSAGWSDD